MVTKKPSETAGQPGTSDTVSELVIQKRKRKKGGSGSEEKEKLDLSLALFIGRTTATTNLVEDKYFRSFCKDLNPEVSNKVIVYRICGLY